VLCDTLIKEACLHAPFGGGTDFAPGFAAPRSSPDASHSLGARNDLGMSGTPADLNVFSFHAT
jgi:hypothetical protein